MAFYIGTDKVIEDTDASAGISVNSNLDKLQINGTDVLTHDGSTVTLKNVAFDDASEVSINTDNLTEGSTNLFYATSLFNTDLATKTTDDLTEGSTNLYYTDARADARATLRINDATTDNIDEGSTNLYYTDARVDARLSGGSLASLTTTGNVVVGGDLTVSGTTTTIDTNELNIGDNIITLNSDETGTPSQNAGIEVERGTSDNVGIRWNETSDSWEFTNDGTSYTALGTTYVSADFTHDDLTGFVANEHIDWTAASAGTIDPSNYTNTGDTTYTAGNGLTLTGTEFTMSGSYTGSFTATGDITAYSDARLKRNIETISNPVDLVNCLRGVNFEKDGRHSTGVIAQEVEEFLPEVVHTDSEGMKSVAYGNISGLLIEAIKEQQKTIEHLQKQITDLQNK